MSHNNQKKIAVINDFSGFGRCSVAVALPIISAMKIQCCPLPTAIFSNHTGFQSFFWTDYTEHITDYAAEWKKLDLRFNGIATGFLGSIKQIDYVEDFLTQFQQPDTVVLVDPVMGDYGSLYATYTPELASGMSRLVNHATILTPNLTEACVLTNTPYDPNISEGTLLEMCRKLHAMGPAKIVISGLDFGQELGNYVYEAGITHELIRSRKVGEYRSGTGDVFASIICADAVNGVSFLDSVSKAAAFIAHALERTIEMDLPRTDGIAFEEVLGDLIPASSN